MLELAELILKQVGGSSKLTFHPLPGDDPLQRQPDITLAKEKLGWEPTISLEQGLEKTIDYFRSVIAGQETYQFRHTGPIEAPSNHLPFPTFQRFAISPFQNFQNEHLLHRSRIRRRPHHGHDRFTLP